MKSPSISGTGASGTGVWEQRWHPLREEWVIVAAHRQNRPWIGARILASTATGPPPRHDPTCTFCPGNLRVSGARNPDYAGLFLFDNDAPCVGEQAPRELEAADAGSGILKRRAATGVARVVCFSPRHDLTLAQMSIAEIDALLALLAEQQRELMARPEVEHVLVFENKGEVVGVSNPHPHGQIYAVNFPFKTMEVEADAGRRHFEATGRVLFEDILVAERADGRRLLFENDSAIAFVPFFARFAYEVFVAPLQTHADVCELAAGERQDFAAALKAALLQLDRLWNISMPYVLVLHQAPKGDPATRRAYHFHVEIHPPLRQPQLLKYLAGPEIGGGSFLSDTSPEEKAAELKAARAAPST